MKVLIYDKDIKFLSKVEKSSRIITAKHFSCSSLYTFFDAHLLISNINKKHDECKIVFLSVSSGINHVIEISKHIQKISSKLIIVYIVRTLREDENHYINGKFKIISKLTFEDSLSNILHSIKLDILQKCDRSLIINTSKYKGKIKFDSIITIFKLDHNVHITTTTSVYVERTSLKRIYEKLDSDYFIKVNSGTIINLRYVTELKGDDIYLSDGSKLIVSRYIKQHVYSMVEKHFKDLSIS